MIEYVGIGVVMGNVVFELKEIVDFVIKLVDEDGIVYVVKELGFLK